MSSRHYFEFLSQVFDNLPEADKERMAELWMGYEQVFAATYQQFAERKLNVSIEDLLPYDTERWLPYTFGPENTITRSATYTSPQDLSAGINLTSKYLIRFGWDSSAPIEIDLRGLVPQKTTIDEIKRKINTAAGFTFVSGVYENTILQFSSPTSGPTSKVTFYPVSDPDKDASEYVLGLLYDDLPASYPEYPYPYSVSYSRVVEIPAFRDSIRDESVTMELLQGVDYGVERTGVVAFKTPPPAKLWAKRTLLDRETPWNNFGYLLDIYQKNSPSYVQILQGLWFAFWNGPRPELVRRAIYLLFGLPTAQEDATVTKVTATLIETTASNGVVRTFEIPVGLAPEVAEGDSVIKFQPLVNGISVFDKINYPGFVEAEVGRAGIQRFLTEKASRGSGPETDETKALRMLEEHAFLPQILVDAFSNPDINLANVKSFLTSIQPLSKTFLFQVIVGAFRENLPVKDRLSMSVGIDVTPNLDSNQTTHAESSILQSYETVDNPAMNLDSDGGLFRESVSIEVRSFGVLIDSFVA